MEKPRRILWYFVYVYKHDCEYGSVLGRLQRDEEKEKRDQRVSLLLMRE